MKKLLLSLIIGFGLSYVAFSQVTPVTLHGYVYDSIVTNKRLMFKTVYIYADSNPTWNYYNTTMTDSSGYYSITMTPPAGNYYKLHAYVIDCNLNSVTFSFTNSGSTIFHYFNVCSGTPPFHADFYYYSSGKHQIAFTDNSTGNIISWYWKFGDGTYSTLKNPVHTFPAIGAYTVCLKVTDVSSSADSICKLVNIIDSSFCFAYFTYSLNNLTATFTGNVSDSNATTYYHWDFGDGTTGNGQFQTHIYPSVSNYYVCVNTTSIDKSGDTCRSYYCNYINFTPPYYTIYGMISNSSYSVDHAKVYLIYYNPLDSTLTAVDTAYAMDSSGISIYYFGNVPAGSYLVKATLTSSSTNYTHCMPTYYGNVLYWNLATYATVNTSNKYITANIQLITGTNPGGPGFIGGKTSQGANTVYNPGDPIPEIEVLLIDYNTDIPVEYDYTDVSGQFDFSNLAYGTYKVYAEIAGKTTYPPIVTINSANPSVNNINLLISSKTVTGIFDNRVAGIINGTSQVYPNPSNGSINIDLTLTRASDIGLNIINQTGQMVYQSKSKYSGGRHQLTVNIETLPAGLYILNLRTDDGGYVARQFMLR